MGLFLLKYFGFYCLWVGIGGAFFALHVATLLSGRFYWLFWPDIDIKFIDQHVEYINARFCFYVIFLWPFRMIQIFVIHLGRTIGLIGIAIIVMIMLSWDFYKNTKEKIFGHHDVPRGA